MYIPSNPGHPLGQRPHILGFWVKKVLWLRASTEYEPRSQGCRAGGSTGLYELRATCFFARDGASLDSRANPKSGSSRANFKGPKYPNIAYLGSLYYPQHPIFLPSEALGFQNPVV